MKHAMRLLAGLLFASACGDDDGGTKASAELASMCEAQCQRGQSCGLLGSVTLRQCQSACEDANRESIDNAPCQFTQDEVQRCNQATAALACSDLANGVSPAECTKRCSASD